VRTATPPGMERAAAASIRSISAWAGSARTGLAWRRPRTPISAAKRACPVTFGRPSRRGIGRPIALVRRSKPQPRPSPQARPPHRGPGLVRRAGSRTSCGPFRSTRRPDEPERAQWGSF
jgi:hypothetical protein